MVGFVGPAVLLTLRPAASLAVGSAGVTRSRLNERIV
jgi:hypothetical protein